MNALSNILRVLAIIGALAAGAMFYLTQNKVKDLNDQLSSATASSSKQVSVAKDDAKATQEKLDKSDADLKAANDKLTAAQSEIDAEKSLRAEAVKDSDNYQKMAKQAKAELDDKQAAMDDLTKKANASDDLKKQVDTLSAQNQTLETELKDAKAHPVEASSNGGTSSSTSSTDNGSASVAAAVATGPATPASILQVDASSGLLTLDAGTAKGIANKDGLVLQQAGVELARISVVNAAADYSVATITSTSGMSTSDFFKIVKKGLKVDFVHLK